MGSKDKPDKPEPDVLKDDKPKPSEKIDKEKNREWQKVDGINFPKPIKVDVAHYQENEKGQMIKTIRPMPVFVMKLNIHKKLPQKGE